MNRKAKYYLEETVSWLMVNLVLPMLLPVLILFCARFLIETDKSFGQIFYELMGNGLYIFSGITLLLSIFQDYKDAAAVVKPIEYLGIMGFLFVMALMFMCSNNIITTPEHATFGNYKPAFIGLLVVNILFCLYLKVKILIYQFTKNLK